jgi:uncharacterized protein (DUF427 family)
MDDYPKAIVASNHTEPVPRRVRAYLGGQVVVDTTQARYVWEVPHFPQFYVPLTDVTPGVLVSEGHTQHSPRGDLELCGLRVGDTERRNAAKVLRESNIAALSGTVRFEWSAMDAWFEEDEQVFGHPRSPYVRVDAIRSTRSVRVELDGVVLASSSSPVMVFETGLPTRYYVNRTEISRSNLFPSPTVTSCPYKGTTGAYWSARIGEQVHEDIAWSYDFPTRQLLPIAGLVAFYNERVDLFVDGARLDRPLTVFSRSRT